ncbi:MAG: indole-3-glycerol phosphate synthase TrpC [Acidobacteria bacterium]|nr:indole-3-glycerol phosphate synthase TrpC [Acidobacteriota bacterium]
MRAAELTILDQIVVRKRAELLMEQASTPIEELEELPRPARRSFREALEMARPAIISEIKKASPSAGIIAQSFNPAAIAMGYEGGGAAALSVLTDQQFFQGSLDDLDAARSATGLPVLRKDFTLDRYHLVQASAAGADAILLIVAALSDYELVELLNQARELELDALVEVHDEPELDRALAAGADLIGVNNRNLKTLEVTLETSFRLAPLIPDDILSISESGIRSAADIRRLMELGYGGFLIGESLMKHNKPGLALAGLIEGVRHGDS